MCSILTIDANDLISSIHDRMPIMLDIEDAKRWISKDAKINELKELFLKYDDRKLMMYLVTEKVNYVLNGSPDNMKEVTENTLF